MKRHIQKDTVEFVEGWKIGNEKAMIQFEVEKSRYTFTLTKTQLEKLLKDLEN